MLSAFIDIQKRLNSLAPINATLPSKLLLEVFKLAVYASECSWTIPIPLNRRIDEADSQVIRLTHVCTYWRDVVLNGPQLWTRVDGHSDTLGKLVAFLERSQDLPTSLRLRHSQSNGPDDGELRQWVAKNGSRLRTLHLDIDIQAPFVPLLSSLPAPALECLTVSSSRDEWEHRSRCYDDDTFQRSPSWTIVPGA